jgi:fibronectin type 3 domain-containing protein
MSISQDDFLPSIYRSKQEFLASLPPWRRLLANLNWHPTIDKKVERYAIEQRLLQLRKENEQLKIEDEQRRIAHEQKLLQLEKEDEQQAIEDEQQAIEDEQRRIAHEQRLLQLENENARLAELNAKIAALWPSSNSSSTPAPPTANDSPT